MREKEDCCWKEQGLKLITKDDRKIGNDLQDLDSNSTSEAAAVLRSVGDLANRMVLF